MFSPFGVKHQKERWRQTKRLTRRSRRRPPPGSHCAPVCLKSTGRHVGGRATRAGAAED